MGCIKSTKLELRLKSTGTSMSVRIHTVCSKTNAMRIRELVTAPVTVPLDPSVYDTVQT